MVPYGNASELSRHILHIFKRWNAIYHAQCYSIMNAWIWFIWNYLLWNYDRKRRRRVIWSFVVWLCSVAMSPTVHSMGISTININETLANAFQDLLIISDQTLALILFAFEIHAFGFMTLFLWIFTFPDYGTMEHFRRLCLNNNRFPFLDKFIRLMCLNYAHSRGQSKVSNVFMEFTSYESVLQQIL